MTKKAFFLSKFSKKILVLKKKLSRWPISNCFSKILFFTKGLKMKLSTLCIITKKFSVDSAIPTKPISRQLVFTEPYRQRLRQANKYKKNNQIRSFLWRFWNFWAFFQIFRLCLWQSIGLGWLGDTQNCIKIEKSCIPPGQTRTFGSPTELRPDSTTLPSTLQRFSFFLNIFSYFFRISGLET